MLILLILMLLLIVIIFLVVLVVELVAVRRSSMRHIVLLDDKLVLLLGLLSEWLGALGTISKLFEVLVHPVGQHNLTTVLSQSILSSQISNRVSIRLIDPLSDHLLSSLNSFTLPAELFFLILALFPLLVSDASHNPLVCLSLLLTFLQVPLFLVVILLLDLLILLLEKALLKPLFEEAVGGFLLCLLL